MGLHLLTLLWFMGLASFTMAIAVLVVGGRTRSSDGLIHWGAALACHGLTYPLFALRLQGWPDFSIVSSCLATSATLALNIRALSLFQRDAKTPLGLRAIWSPVFATGVMAFLTVHDHAVRNALFGVITSGQALVFARLALAPPEVCRRERSRILLVFGSAALVVLLLARTVAIALSRESTEGLGVPVDIQAYAYLVALMILLFNTVGFLLMQKDKAVEAQRSQARHDPLTGIYNRRALVEELQRIIAKSVHDRSPVSMLMIDLDLFKKVNDTYGHLVGDEVLAAVCQRVTARLRHGDLFARFGGEEFVVVLPDTKVHDALKVAESIREVVAAEPLAVTAHRIPVTISIGVQSMQAVAIEGAVDRLIAGCDEALYRAKANGRNRVEVLSVA
jgi:diguanylate cyclase (GGDEF)-like protein